MAADPLLGHCKICILVLETLHSGFPFSLSTICQNTLAMEKNEADFEICEEVVAVLSEYGPSVALWQEQGCFRTEEYGAVEQMIPCPPHVICSQMETLRAFVIPPANELGGDPKYDHGKLRAPQIRPKSSYAAHSSIDKSLLWKDQINTFCPPPKPQYVSARI